MPLRVAVIDHEALLPREDRVVAPHAAILAGVPEGAALAEDDVARDDELGGRFFGAEAFSGATGGFISAAFGGVGGVPVLGGVEGEEGEERGEGGWGGVVVGVGEEGGEGSGGEAGEVHCCGCGSDGGGGGGRRMVVERCRLGGA